MYLDHEWEHASVTTIVEGEAVNEIYQCRICGAIGHRASASPNAAIVSDRPCLRTQ